MSKRIATFCTELIADSGPLELGELARRVSAAGLTRARNPESVVKSALSQTSGILELPDGRFDSVRRMLDGAVLTHRVRAATTGCRVLYGGPELALLDELLSTGPLPLATGGQAHRASGDLDGIVGPPGWLPDVPADTLVALRLAGGTLRAGTVDAGDDVLAARAERLRVILAKHLTAAEPKASWRSTSWHSDWPDYGRVRSGWRRTLLRAVLYGLAECPDLLAEPVPPLDEVLRLPPLSWDHVWTAEEQRRDHLVAAVRNGSSLTLHGVPAGLRGALERLAERSGVPVGELAVLQLAAATYRWEDACRHDLEQAWLERMADDERERARRRYETLDEPPFDAARGAAVRQSVRGVAGRPGGADHGSSSSRAASVFGATARNASSMRSSMRAQSTFSTSRYTPSQPR